MADATIVVGLGFGDEGKGATVDALTRRRSAKLVVRFNGGAQAGHNVVTPDGRHHCFSQWGSGTFAGARTFLSRFMLVNPIFALSEALSLSTTGVSDPLSLLYVSAGAAITTPFHVSANRCREMLRAAEDGKIHGSCGMGIGETMADVLAGEEDCIAARDLVSSGLEGKLRSIQERKRAEVMALLSTKMHADPERSRMWQREMSILSGEHEVHALCLKSYRRFADHSHIVDDGWLENELVSPGHVIFEGAQGVLLDQDFGIAPYTTWSKCTFDNARELIDDVRAAIPTRKLGVLRTYHTRHGAGPFLTEDAAFNVWSTDDHNTHGEWQHGFRSGAFDGILAYYALGAVGGCDGLVLTHMDKLRAGAKVATSWKRTTEGPEYEYVDIDDDRGLSYAKRIAARLDLPLAMLSWGKTAADRQEL